MSLQNLIIQRDAHALHETRKQNLARHLQICTKAFQKSSAKSILQEDRIQFLTTINNEAKVRRSTKSLVLGKAKVMSYEDLEVARAKRVVKESTQAAKCKGKRDRKSKSSPPEPEEDTAETARCGRKRKSAELETPEPTNKTARISNAAKPASALVMQASRTQIAEDDCARTVESSSGADVLAKADLDRLEAGSYWRYSSNCFQLAPRHKLSVL